MEGLNCGANNLVNVGRQSHDALENCKLPHLHSRDPNSRDPHCRDPHCRDPYSRDPYSRDPHSRNPFCRIMECILSAHWLVRYGDAAK